MDRAARAARSGRGSVSRGQGRATRRTTGFGNARRAGGGGGRGTALGTGRLRGIIRTRRAGTRQNASRLDPERLSLAARPATPFRRVDPDDEDDDDSLPDYVNDNGQDPNDSDDSGSGDSNHGDGDYQHHGHVGGKRKTEAEWRDEQDKHLAERRKLLRAAHKEDVEHEIRMLHKPWEPVDGVPVLQDRNPFARRGDFDNSFWFRSSAMDGSTGYTLEQLSTYARAYLTDDELRDIDKDMGAMRRDGILFDYWNTDRLPLSRGLQRIANLVADFDDPDTPANRSEPLRRLNLLLKSLQILRVLRRFTDRRNPEVTEAPLPDATNFPPQSHFLTASWVLHRCYIRMLHLRSLMIGADAIGEQHLNEIGRLALAFLKIEQNNVRHDPQGSQSNPAVFSPIKELNDQISIALEGIAVMMQGSAGIDIEALMNLHADPVIMGHLYLASRLLRESESFETDLDVEHVEDVLIEKRIVYNDEWYHTYRLLRHGDYNPLEVGNLPFLSAQDGFVSVRDRLQIVSQPNRYRRNMMLLKNWNQKRPWKQLYIPLRTTGHPDRVARKTLIQHFVLSLQHMHTLFPQDHPDDRNKFNPSNPANIMSSLFPVHPISLKRGEVMRNGDTIPLSPGDSPGGSAAGSQNDEVDTYPQHFEDGCAICAEAFEDDPDVILAALHCNHLFHHACIRRYWDDEDRQSFPCPLCRTSMINWSLKSVAGITPEVDTVWDYETLVDSRHRLAYPDFDPVAYHTPEHERQTMCMFFDTEYNEGYPGTVTEYTDGTYGPAWRDTNPAFPPDPDRMANMEMSMVRRWRRQRNRERRRRIQAAGRGIKVPPQADRAVPPLLPQVQYEHILDMPRLGDLPVQYNDGIPRYDDVTGVMLYDGTVIDEQGRRVLPPGAIPHNPFEGGVV